MPTVLVIDDDRSVARLVAAACRPLQLEVVGSHSAEDGLSRMREVAPDVLLLDIRLPGTTGLKVCEQVREIDERVPIVFITADGESDTAIEAMKLGPLDFLSKPLDVARVRELVEQGLEIRRLTETPVELPSMNGGAGGEHQLLGRSPQMLEVYKAIGRVAPHLFTVLIRGESGTGKELIARAIYHHSPRRGKPFLAVNCAALPETLLESELFGHEKGSFTGAEQRRIGKFEQCNGGTIFLDEVGDMAPLAQAKLLRLLQEQRFERVGGNETIETDVRIITATNRNLEQMVEEGEFRSDLYYRLNEFTIKVPPLRERGDDLLLLIQELLARFAIELGKPLQKASPDAIKLLLEYPWPGNVRELQSVLRTSLLRLSGPVLLPEFLPPELLTRHTGEGGPELHGDAADAPPHDLAPLVRAGLAANSESLYAEALELTERYVLSQVLHHTGGNQSQAARILGITRGSLRNKTGALGIRVGQVVSTAVRGNGDDAKDSGEDNGE